MRNARAHEGDVVPGADRELKAGLVHGAVVAEDGEVAGGAAADAAEAGEEGAKAAQVDVLADAELSATGAVADGKNGPPAARAGARRSRLHPKLNSKRRRAKGERRDGAGRGHGSGGQVDAAAGGCCNTGHRGGARRRSRARGREGQRRRLRARAG